MLHETRATRQGGKWWGAEDEWGDYRASLIPLQGQANDKYIHGKDFYFKDGLDKTHGCIGTPYQNVLKTLWQLNPNGVGEGNKNGRIAVYVSGK